MTEIKACAGTDEERLRALADAVREACIQAALDGYEQAGMSGLCAEGRWEMAVDSMRSLDLGGVLRACAR